MSPGIVVGSILLASDQLFRVEELTIGSSANLINNSGFEINKDSSGYVLSSSSLREKGVEGIISTANGFV